MMFCKADKPTGRGYASVVLLWFVVALAAAHGVFGTVSPARSARLLTDQIGPAGTRAGDTSQDRTGMTGQQRLFVIADWRGLALKSLLPSGDGDPAILPATQWYLASESKPCLIGIASQSLHEARALVLRARAPPVAARAPFAR